MQRLIRTAGAGGDPSFLRTAAFSEVCDSLVTNGFTVVTRTPTTLPT